MRNAVNVLIVVVWRIMQIMIIVPAGIIGGVLAILVIIGESPVDSLLLGLFDYAETQVRPAPAGFVLERSCPAELSGISTEIRPLPAVVCTNPVVTQITIGDAVQRARNAMGTIYVALVLLSIIVVVGLCRDRHFWGGRGDSTQHPELA